jgi:glutamate dehydrogenase/leucine dehydrogenase
MILSFWLWEKMIFLSCIEKLMLAVHVRLVSACVILILGGILNPTTIPNIKASIIVGAANNQLKDINNDDKLLKRHGIMYLPDFLVNRMGIVNCADEHLGTIKNDPKLEKHLGRSWDNSIYNLSMKIMKESLESEKTTHQVYRRENNDC